VAVFLTQKFRPFITKALGGTVTGYGVIGWTTWGSGLSPASPILLAVSGEQGPSRAGTTTSLIQTLTPQDTLQIVGAKLISSTSFTLTQVGLTDAASGGNLLAVADISPTITINPGDSLTVTFSIEII
jgi:hypothetical protein